MKIRGTSWNINLERMLERVETFQPNSLERSWNGR